jgi:hypothetical protein
MKATTRPGTVGKLAKVGMLAKVVNQRERPITAGTQLTSMTAAAGTIGTPLEAVDLLTLTLQRLRTN